VPLLVIAAEAPRASAARRGLVAEAGLRGVKVLTLEDERVTAIDGAAAACEADAIAVCGGASMQGSVAAVAVGRDLPFACISAGPDDLLAHDMRVDLDDPHQALSHFLGTRERAIDLAEVNGIAFVNYVAFGLHVVPLERPEEACEPGAELARARIRRGRPSGLRAFEDGAEAPAPMMLVTNNRFALDGEHLGARARIDAGVLGIAILDAPPGERTQIGMSGRAHQPMWRERSASTLELAAGAPVIAEVDGCRRLLRPPLRFRVLPRALRVRTMRRARTDIT
jgi:diacylglycerol kinase family enzyme